MDKIPYPKRVFFIIGNEFCERFNYYGIRSEIHVHFSFEYNLSNSFFLLLFLAILALYLKYKLDYTEKDATVLLHGFTVMAYVMCIFGGVLSDVWLGKFKTIFYLSIVYSIGSAVVSLSSVPHFKQSAEPLLIIGLVLIAVGSGGIKPCVSAFGGDQFKLPEQASQFATFFSIFYFAINSGSLLSTTFTPILRADVYCFGSNDCFPLAFGLPAVLMLVSIGIILRINLFFQLVH